MLLRLKTFLAEHVMRIRCTCVALKAESVLLDVTATDEFIVTPSQE